MAQQPQSDEELVEELHEYAKQMAYAETPPRVIIEKLVKRGLDESRASIIAYNFDYEVMRNKHKAKGIRVIKIGSLIVGIGILATLTIGTFMTGIGIQPTRTVSGWSTEDSIGVTCLCTLILLNSAGVVIFLRGWSKAYE